MSGRSRVALTVLGAVCVLVACQSGGNRSGGGGQPAAPGVFGTGTQPQSVPQVLAPTPQPTANSCAFSFDGECDEPGIGTGTCALGTDTADCTPPPPSTPPALFPSTPVTQTGPDSCQYAFDGECDEAAFGGTGACAAGTDTTDCTPRSTPLSPSGLNSCQYAFDGECDDASLGGTGACAANTDTADCVPPSTPALTPVGSNSCQYAFDGECDEAAFGGTGACAAGTDTADCTPRSTPALTPVGSNSCQYAFDGECDDPSLGGTGACAAGTDVADCS